MEIVSEYLAGLGLDVIKDSATERIDEVKLKSRLRSFIEQHRKYNEVCTLVEEYDFQGIVEYISDNLLEVAKIRFRSTNSKERGRARQEIIDAAVSYSEASTEEAKKQVGRLIGCSLDIVGEFFKEKIPLQYYYLAADMVDSIKENTDERGEKIIKEVGQVVSSDGDKTRHSVEMMSKEISELKKSLPIGALFSIDRACDLMQSGQQSVIEKNLNKLLDHMSIEHPLYTHEICEYDQRKPTLPFLREYVDLILCGHTETGGLPVIYDQRGGAQTLTGGAAYYSDDHANAYSVILLNEEWEKDCSRKIAVAAYIYSEENGWHRNIKEKLRHPIKPIEEDLFPIGEIHGDMELILYYDNQEMVISIPVISFLGETETVLRLNNYNDVTRYLDIEGYCKYFKYVM